jgi:Uma2 family endonuclease
MPIVSTAKMTAEEFLQLGEDPPGMQIINPSSGDIDREDKFKQYAKGGVAHYWIIDPQERTAEAYSLVRGKYRLAASAKGNQTVNFPPFQELEIPLAELWHPEP